MSATYYLAVDLGAESGRVMVGTLDNGRVSLEEIHRFPNRVLNVGKHLHWDLTHLEKEIFAGLDMAAAKKVSISGISTDSWGVDYVLLDAKGKVLGEPYCYRDEAAVAESPKRLVQEIAVPGNLQGNRHPVDVDQHAVPLSKRSSMMIPKVFAGTDQFLNIADYFGARFSGC